MDIHILIDFRCMDVAHIITFGKVDLVMEQSISSSTKGMNISIGVIRLTVKSA